MWKSLRATIRPASYYRASLRNLCKGLMPKCPVVEETDKYAIHRLDEASYFDGLKRRRKLDRLDQGLNALPGAVLMSVIAAFESTLSNSIRAMLRKRSDRYTAGEKTIRIADVLSKSSFEEVIEQIISEELYTFFRGSHADQVKFIDTNFGIGIRGNWKRYPDFIEVFERRNLVAHGEDKFTSRYYDICAANDHKGSDKIVGKEIQLSPDYLTQALDILTEFNILLSFSFWRKEMAEDEPTIFAKLNTAAYDLINKISLPACCVHTRIRHLSKKYGCYQRSQINDDC